MINYVVVSSDFTGSLIAYVSEIDRSLAAIDLATVLFIYDPEYSSDMLYMNDSEECKRIMNVTQCIDGSIAFKLKTSCEDNNYTPLYYLVYMLKALRYCEFIGITSITVNKGIAIVNVAATIDDTGDTQPV